MSFEVARKKGADSESVRTGSPRPSRVRWYIVGLLAVISSTTYLDRINLSIAGDSIKDQFGFSTETMGWVLSAFVLGYALFQVPGGWIGDRYGPRKVLTCAILWWSAFTALVPFAPRIPFSSLLGAAWSFSLIRFLIGIGEGAAFPNANKLIGYWSSPASRGMANSIFFAGVGVGGALTPVIISRIMLRWGWPASFYLCGMLGIAVALVWHRFSTDRPEDHSRVNPSELALIGTRETPVRDPLDADRRVPWKQMFKSRSVLSLMISYFCIGYPAYIYYTWFFIYLVRVRHFTVAMGGLWGSTPYLAIAVLAPVGGWTSDRAVGRWGRRMGRRVSLWLGVVLSAVTLSIGGHVENRVGAVLLLAVAAGFNLFAVPTWWASCNDITRKFCGSLSGLMNMCGNLGGWLSPILTAYLAAHFGWSYALDFAALLTVLSGLIWFFVDPSATLDV